MRILLTGATGFIGRALVPRLQRDGHTVVVWARIPARARARLGAEVEIEDAASGPGALERALDGCSAVVNLAGEPVLGRWTAARRASLRQSRVHDTAHLARAIAALPRRPRVLVSASATGYYGDRGAELLNESSPPGSGALPDLCHAWEQATQTAADAAVRVVTLRLGVVLGRDGGALAAMRGPFSLGLGGPMAGGRQFVPWIHVHDVVDVIARALIDDRYVGPVNLVAPEVVDNRTFTATLARTLHRPAIVPVPRVALRAVLGESAAVLTDSQRVEPAALRSLGYQFAHPCLQDALREIVRGPSVSLGPLSAPIETHGSTSGARYVATRTPVYELRTETTLEVPIERAFAFFAKAENLGLLTPSAMRFVIERAPVEIGEDTTIEYRLRVGPVPIRWRSRIVTWQPGVRFVDLQEVGPYRAWWHEHRFRADGRVTVMEDRVCYAPPFGLIGRLANRLFIEPTLRRIFQYRADVIRLRFEGAA